MAPEPEPTAERAELPMRLTRLRVKNFRSIADIDIPLSPLTVLVGPNGSGKSNVVDALRFVRDVFARGLDQAVMDREGMGVIQRWGTEGEGISIGVTIELPETKKRVHDGVLTSKYEPSSRIDYDFTISDSIDKSAAVISESIKIDANNAPVMKIISNKMSFEVGYGEMEWKNIDVQFNNGFSSNQILQGPENLFDSTESILFSDEEWIAEYQKEEGYSWRRNGVAAFRLEAAIHNALFYTLNPADLRQPQQTLKEIPFDEKGRNLAAVLRRLARSKGLSWENLQFALRQAIAGFDTLEVETVGGYLATKLIYQTDEMQPRTSYLGQESDGTIRMLGLLAALLQEPSQPFISIEEPEANIHPGALAVLAGVLDEASLRSQVLVTTHSPDMLDHLPVESFLVVEKVGDTTHVGPLDASQMASVRKRLFTPGELLRMEGLQRQAEPGSAS